MATARLAGGESKASLQTALILYLLSNNPEWTGKTARAYVRSFLSTFVPEGFGCSACEGTAIHSPRCPRRSDPLPPLPFPFPSVEDTAQRCR